jgi:hypothetical protein
MDINNALVCLSDPRVQKFIREMILDSSGVDIAGEIPSGRVFSEYEQGKMKIGIDMHNFILYNAPIAFKELVKNKQKTEIIDD